MEMERGEFDPTVLFEEHINKYEWQKIAATLALMIAFGTSPIQTNSEPGNMRFKEEISIEEVEIKELKYDNIINNYLLKVANENQWNRKEERSKNIILADEAFKRLSKKGLQIDSTEIVYILSKAYQESRYIHLNQDGEILTSPAGAEGAMQLLKSTVKWMNNNLKDTTRFQNTYTHVMPTNPEVAFGTTNESTVQNFEWGMIYWHYLMNKFHDKKLATIAYNMGPGKTQNYLEHYNQKTMEGLLKAYENDTIRKMTVGNKEIKINIPVESKKYVQEVSKRADEIIESSQVVVRTEYKLITNTSNTVTAFNK